VDFKVKLMTTSAEHITVIYGIEIAVWVVHLNETRKICDINVFLIR